MHRRSVLALPVIFLSTRGPAPSAGPRTPNLYDFTDLWWRSSSDGFSRPAAHLTRSIAGADLTISPPDAVVVAGLNPYPQHSY